MRIENPMMVFVMESRLKKEEAQVIRVKCGFEFGVSVDCHEVGRERVCGLMLLWK